VDATNMTKYGFQEVSSLNNEKLLAIAANLSSSQLKILEMLKAITKSFLG
jgi:hypothetical protein